MSKQTNVPISITAGEALAAFRCVKPFGSTVVYADAGDVPVGITQAVAASGAEAVLRSFSEGTCKVMAADSFSAGARLYVADDGKVSDTINGRMIGTALEAATADGDIIEIVPNKDDVSLMRSQKSAGSALTNSTVETILATTTIHGADLVAGDVIRVVAQGIATATNSTDTLTVKLYVGTEQIATTGAVDVANSDIWHISADVVIRIAGASGHLAGCGTVALGAVGTVTAKPFVLADAAEDVSADIPVKVTGTWGAASSGDSCRNDVFNVQVIRATV
jgi:hypothetical protein